MLVIADNLNIRNKAYMQAVRSLDGNTIESMAKDLTGRGADLINVQCSTDGSGDDKTLPFVAEAVQKGSDLPLCLDSRNAAALKKALAVCTEPPLINYLSGDEENSDEILSLVRDSKANLILRALKGNVPATYEAKLLILEELIEKANSADIPNERLFADPSLIHIAAGMGQENLLNAHECIIALNELVDPPINTIIWLSNVSAGLKPALKPHVNSALLSYLAGAGLDAALLDVTQTETMKTAYMVRAFRDEIIFSPADLS
ncbi:MAG TPA: dihydropteroate synthase [Dissulfurispiraceae bacterium]|nr:dihydropteroate synthase [Dissulfurispiraceae bacterium]